MRYIIIVLFFLTSMTGIYSQPVADTNKQEIKIDTIDYAVVKVMGDSVFILGNGIGSKGLEERVGDISKKSSKLVEDVSYNSKNFRIDSNKYNYFVKYKDDIIVAVSNEDEDYFNKSKKELANEWLSSLINKIEVENEDRSYYSILINVGITLLILLIFYLFIKYVNKLFRIINVKLYQLKDTYIKDVKIKQLKLLDANNLLHFAIIALKGVKVVFILFCLYFVFPIILGLFPWTKGLSEKLFGYVLNPLESMMVAIIGYIPNLIMIVIIIAVAKYFIQFLKFLSNEIKLERLTLPNFYPEWAKPTFNIARFLVYAFVLVMIFPYLPYSDSDIFQGVSIFLGVLVSLGSSTAIANIVSGLVITYMRPFKVGDRVMIDNVTGDVIQKTLLVTRIRTIKNEDITVPNSKILSSHSTNYTSASKDLGLILHTTVTIGYDVPQETVKELLISAAKKSDGVDKDREPFVLQTGLEDFYISYQINAYTKQSHRMAAIYSDIHRNILDEFNKAEVEILSPHYRAERDGNEITIPKKDKYTNNKIDSVIDKNENTEDSNS
ncbi:MAG: mechanosensitive ion channel family protein [Chlorobiota bacterium]